MEHLQPVIKFPCPKDHYAADACIVWCFDDRFSELLTTCKKEREFKHADIVECAGGAKALAAENSPERDFVLNQIAASIRLHATPLIILMTHIDCGAYGGSKAFNNEHDTEWNHHTAELQKATKLVREQFLNVKKVESYIADFDGLYQL